MADKQTETDKGATTKEAPVTKPSKTVPLSEHISLRQKAAKTKSDLEATIAGLEAGQRKTEAERKLQALDVDNEESVENVKQYLLNLDTDVTGREQAVSKAHVLLTGTITDMVHDNPLKLLDQGRNLLYVLFLCPSHWISL